MKQYITIMALSMGLALNGCGNAVSPELPIENTPETTQSEFSAENTAEVKSSDMETETNKSTVAVQGGPYGRLSISLPDGWRYETYPIDSGEQVQGTYGIHFYPEGVANGYIELAYMDNFGVCGTGLSEETAAIADNPVHIGTYDNHKFWDFISFGGAYNGVVVLTHSVEDWWDAYSNQIWDILNTLSFDTNEKEGGAYIYNTESEIDKIGLYFSLKNISAAGATLIFSQYDADAPTGELAYGEDFAIEVQKNGMWENVPITIEGDYAFNTVAYIIASGDTFEQELRWNWLYGTLAPGNYRIKKTIMDFRGSGDFDEYTVCAYFVLN